MKILLCSISVILLTVACFKYLYSSPVDLVSAEKTSAISVQAGPQGLGMPVPVPEPALPPEAGAFNPPSYEISDAAPAIAELSKTADRDEIVSMTGAGLDEGSVFNIFSQAPGAPEGSVVSVKPLTADTTAATVLLPVTLASQSMYLIWPSRNGFNGRPVAVNRTEAWWVGPEKGTPGSTISVYGRNLAEPGGATQPNIYIKPIDQSGWYLRATSVNPFRVEFEIPDLPSAIYEIWMHNGEGGRYGWSGPLKLEILAQPTWAGQDQKVIDVRRFGARGNGSADDTRGVEQALEAASKSAPATIYFPKGKYSISDTLNAPSNVAWLGDGEDETEIRLTRAIGESLIVSPGDNVGFRKLTLKGDRNTGDAPLIRLYSAMDTRFESVRIDAWGAPALDAQDAHGLSIENSELIENGSFYGTSRQVFLIRNRFRMTGYGESVVALWGGRDFSMIGNELTNADESRDDGHGIGRFFVGQAHFGSMRNLYWEKNISRNAAPHDCDKVDCNKGEQICFEIVGSELKNDFVGATSRTVTFRSLTELEKPLRGGRDLVIVGGRGAGQHRHIVSGSDTTVVLETDWNVIPDETSRFALAATASRAAIYDNTFDGRGTYSQHDSDSTGVLLYGNVYDVVVDSNRISRMRHGMMTVALDSSEGLSPYFLQYSNNRVTSSNSGLYVGTTFADSGEPGIWGGLGNVYRKNVFEDIAYIGVEYETWDHNGADYNGTVFEQNRFTGLRYGFIDGYKLMWTHDGAFKAGPPSARSRRFNTVLRGNEFNRDSAPLEGSTGFLSLHPDNTWLNMGSTWAGFASGNEGPRVLPK